MSLDLLSRELLVEVLQRLGSASDLANATCSAQFIKAAAAQHGAAIWRALTLKRWPAADSSVVAAMGLSWKARYRHYHARAALDRLQSQRRPPSWESLTVAEMNEQFSFFIENHSDSRNHMINYVPKGDESARTNVGKTATTIRAVVSEEGWQTAESNRWSLKAVEEVSAKDFGPNLEIFVLRHADHAFASFVELIEQDEYSFEVYAGWYAANNWNWVPGEPIIGSVVLERRTHAPPFPLLRPLRRQLLRGQHNRGLWTVATTGR